MVCDWQDSCHPIQYVFEQQNPMQPASHGDIMVLREDFRRHEDQDRADFAAMRTEVQRLATLLSQWSGALAFAKWSMGLGMPAIFGAVVTHVVRHW